MHENPQSNYPLLGILIINAAIPTRSQLEDECSNYRRLHRRGSSSRDRRIAHPKSQRRPFARTHRRRKGEAVAVSG